MKGKKTMAKKETATALHATPAGGSMDVPLKLIVVDESFNVRQTKDEKKIEELAKSLDAEGQIQDAIVEPNGDGTYTLRAGHRRLAAAKLLEWDTLRCTVWIPSNAKGEPLTDEKEKDVARYFLNMAENVARANISTYDLAMRCKLMKRKYELTGGDVSKRLGKATSYINNLLAVVGEGEKGEHAGNTLAEPILKQWREECSWDPDDVRTRICHINQLRRWVRMGHEDQMKDFNEELFVAGGGDRDEYRKKLQEANGGSAAQAGAGGGDGEGARREGKAVLEMAVEQAKYAKKEAKSKEEVTRFNGIIDALEFALGVKTGSTNRIKGVCAFKDGKLVEGVIPEKKEEKKESRAQA